MADNGIFCGFELVREGQYTFAGQTPFALRMFPACTPTLMMFRCEVCGQIKLFDAASSRRTRTKRNRRKNRRRSPSPFSPPAPGPARSRPGRNSP